MILELVPSDLQDPVLGVLVLVNPSQTEDCPWLSPSQQEVFSTWQRLLCHHSVAPYVGPAPADPSVTRPDARNLGAEYDRPFWS